MRTQLAPYYREDFEKVLKAAIVASKVVVSDITNIVNGQDFESTSEFYDVESYLTQSFLKTHNLEKVKHSNYYETLKNLIIGLVDHKFVCKDLDYFLEKASTIFDNVPDEQFEEFLRYYRVFPNDAVDNVVQFIHKGSVRLTPPWEAAVPNWVTCYHSQLSKEVHKQTTLRASLYENIVELFQSARLWNLKRIS